MITEFKEYQYTKSTRFNLKGDLPKTYDNNINIYEFIRVAKEFHKELNKIFIGNRKNAHDHDTSQIMLRNKWTKQYENFLHYSSKNKIINNIIVQIEKFGELIRTLDELGSRKISEKKESPRKSEFNNIITQICSKKISDYLIELTESIKIKNRSIKDLEILAKRFKEIMLPVKENFLSSKSTGVEVLRASFNYFTVNKKPKDFDSELEEIEEILSKPILKIEHHKEAISLKWNRKDIIKHGKINRIYTEVFETEILRSYKLKEFVCKKELNIADTDGFLKIFTSELKDKCLKTEYEKIKGKTKIFDDDSKLEDIHRSTRKIIEANKQGRIGDIKRLKDKRGRYFFVKNNECFNGWKKLIESYRTISQKYGNLKTKRKAIEKSKHEAELLKYWALILEEENGKKYLLLIPIDKKREVKNELKKISDEKKGNLKIYVFNSLTRRALDKLLFSQESSFFKEMKSTDRKTYGLLKRARESKGNKRTRLKLEVYKKILFTEYAKERLELDYFDLEGIKSVKNTDDFERVLEKGCYHKETIYIDQKRSEELLKRNNIIRCLITSYDLEGRFKKNNPESKPKPHTRNLWNRFWERYDDIRLNPEIRIHYRKKDSVLENYLISKNVDLKKIKNRNLIDAHFVTFTFTLNPGTKYPELAFVKTEDLINGITSFNKKLNKNLTKKAYFFGIDTGEIELATLSVNQFKDIKGSELSEKEKKDIKAEEIKFEYYRLKKEKYGVVEHSDLEKHIGYDKDRKKRKIVANISYFTDKIDDRDYFEKISSSAIDLSCAKVINGHIVENADILTFLQFQKKIGKRKIIKTINEESLSKNDCKLEWKNNYIKFIKLDKKSLYKFRPEYEGIKDKHGFIYSKESIEKCFEKFIEEYFEGNITTPALNNLRKALIGNMIGVLSYLIKQYPGYIVLEIFDAERAKSEEEIPKHLELGLYRKFQSFGLIPPHVKNIIEIREYLSGKKEKKKKKKKAKNEKKEECFQIGNILFINKDNTSKKCPVCGKIAEDKRYNKYKSKREFKCSECDFYTAKPHNYLSSLNDADKIAAFNIAKEGFKYLTNGTKHNNLKPE